MAASKSLADAAGGEKVTIFGFKGCPFSDQRCPKHKVWLGAQKQSFYSERRCRQAVYDHLMSSPHHSGTTAADAQQAAWTAVLEAFEVEQDESPDDISELIAKEEALVYFKDEDGTKVNNTAHAPQGNKGSGSKSSKDGPEVGSGKGHQLVPACNRKRPAEPLDDPQSGRPNIARTIGQLKQNIKNQTQNAFVFVQAMTKAENGLRTAARIAENAHRTFVDIFILM